MALFTGDYLRDTRHLTPLRHGIYLLLLMHCWDQKGPLPLDANECAGIANCRSHDEIHALDYVLSKYFVKMEDGWYNERMQEEIVKAEMLAKNRSKAGKISAAIRARGKVRRAKATSVEQVLNISAASVEQLSVSPSPSPSPSPSLIPKESTTLSGKPDVALFGQAKEILDALNEVSKTQFRAKNPNGKLTASAARDPAFKEVRTEDDFAAGDRRLISAARARTAGRCDLLHAAQNLIPETEL
jgi:uncharacterized protein YdaU (DUF1376 family)